MPEPDKILELVNKYYPLGIDLDDIGLLNDTSAFKALISQCLNAQQLYDQHWTNMIDNIAGKFEVKVFDYTSPMPGNPAYIASIVSDRSEQCKLVLKISKLAPFYTLYFDNLTSNYNYRLIRNNPVTPSEVMIIQHLKDELSQYFKSYTPFDDLWYFITLPGMGNIAINNIKPYLDELLFGVDLSFHPTQ